MNDIINHIKEKQKEYHESSSAYKLLRELEVTLPSLFKAQLQQGGVVRPEVESAKEGEQLGNAKEKGVSDGLCHCVNHIDCDCWFSNECSECGLPLRA